MVIPKNQTTRNRGVLNNENMACPQGEYFDEFMQACLPADMQDSFDTNQASGGGSNFWDKVKDAVGQYGPSILIGAGGYWQGQQSKNNEQGQLLPGAGACGQGTYYDTATSKCTPKKQDGGGGKMPWYAWAGIAVGVILLFVVLAKALKPAAAQ
jgi:hypothetical protein